MHTIYLDNFRGFRQEFTPLSPVTFLVGENSTGKTSFLAAVELLSSFDFWIEPKFGKNDTNLGAFQEIVSKNSKKRDYFTMGWSFCSLDSDPAVAVFALLTFKEQNGKPRLFRYSFLYHDSIVKVQFTEKRVGYRIDKIQKFQRSHEGVNKSFALTANSHMTSLRNLTYLDGKPTDYPLRSPFFGPQHYIKNFVEKKKKSSFSDPVMLAGLHATSIAPIRTQPSPIYDSLEPDADNLGNHTPYVLRRELDPSNTTSHLREGLQKFGLASGLFKDIQIHNFGDSGDSPSGSGVPFEIGVVLDKKPINLPFVGYGVSQVLPIAVEIILGDRGDSYIIQQPEVHLHPRAQAAFGDLLYEVGVSKNMWLFVETHSDYLVDRFRLAVSKDEDMQVGFSSSVLFFEQEKGFNQTAQVKINADGTYDSAQPKSFRRFFLNEQIELFGV
ncbi:MAG: ATP-binding protein [Gammaproteobacteria bacterium]|nr:ATP-binding protein [Gammaproteobacteria bacterium]